jgi:hypothetical protein
MDVVIHIGYPKTGSSSIQAHLAKNRNWLLTQGILIPQTGFNYGHGHNGLFNAMLGRGVFNNPLYENNPLNDGVKDTLLALRKELSDFEKQGGGRAIISWEGFVRLKSSSVKGLANCLRGHNVTVVGYLREQAELLQTIYLQGVKRKRQESLMDDFYQSPNLLTPASMNIYEILSLWRASFDEKAGFVTRIYDRSNLLNNDIVDDFFDCIKVELNDNFSSIKSDQNSSIDVPSAKLLNLVDQLSCPFEGRNRLSDALLLNINTNGAGEKYFLKEENVSYIRNHYSESNRLVLEEFTPNNIDVQEVKTLFDNKKVVHVGEIDADKDIVKLVTESLVQMRKDFYWDGRLISGLEIAPMIKSDENGWGKPRHKGSWSIGRVSKLSFFVPNSIMMTEESNIPLLIRGQYYADNSQTTVKVNQQEPFIGDLQKIIISIPKHTLSDNGKVEIVLTHEYPVSPKQLGESDDEREIAYRLEECSFEIS